MNLNKLDLEALQQAVDDLKTNIDVDTAERRLRIMEFLIMRIRRHLAKEDL